MPKNKSHINRENRYIFKDGDEICSSLDDYFTDTHRDEVSSDSGTGKGSAAIEKLLKRAIKYMYADDIEGFKKLIKNNITLVNKMNNKGVYLLHLACYNKKHEFISFLLLMKADPNRRDHIGKAAQHYAIMSNDLQTIDLLVLSGVDIDVQDLDGDTPLHYAVTESNMQIVDALINHQADPLIKNKKGLAPIDYSINNNDILVKLGEYMNDYVKHNF